MCGIAGVVGRWPDLDLTAFRDAAFRVMACRGPDGKGAVVARDGAFVTAAEGPVPADADLLLVHRRLAVLDLTAAGAQPMCAGAAAMTYNGEVYNYESLRDALGLAPSALRGHSDTEVMLHWLGAGRPVDAFTGMFAFAHADLAAGSVTLLRDPYGIKPLFIARRAAALAFASDLRLLLTLPGIDRGVDAVRALEFLRYGGQTTGGHRTAFRGIETLAPGERWTVALDGGAVTRGSWLPPAPPPFRGTFEQAAAQVREAFLESVRLHLKSDVRVGCALSGGIDSSAILCAMRTLLGPRGELHAVSHVADDAARSEERWIDLAAGAAGAVVHKVRPAPADMVADLDDLVLAQGEPIGTTSLYAQYGVFRQAKAAGLTVMLDGQGADEMLAGYVHFRAVRLAEFLRRGQLGAAARLVRSPDVGASGGLRSLALLAVRYRLPVRLADRWGARVGVPGLPEWVRPGPAAAAYYAAQDARRARFAEGLSPALAESRATQLCGLLRYEDRNSMRFSIESRVPFLERQLVDLVASLPAEYVLGEDGRTKRVFRAAMRGIVPDAILDRRDKIGFENDEAAWLDGAASWAEALLARAADRSALVDGPVLRAAWQRFRAGDRANAARLWASLLFLRWHEMVDADG